MYNVISGVNEGTILARSPEGVTHQLILGDDTPYIIVTNFDYWDHDIRAYLDPTGGEIGTPRRIAAENVLNNTDVLTPEVLFEAISTKGALAIEMSKTIYQGIFNVEAGTMNNTSPYN